MTKGSGADAVMWAVTWSAAIFPFFFLIETKYGKNDLGKNIVQYH